MPNPVIDIMVRMFANGMIDWSSILGQVILKIQKMVLGTRVGQLTLLYIYIYIYIHKEICIF